MYLYFVDDSGTVLPPNKIGHSHVVLGGVLIPEKHWHDLERDFSLICQAYQVKGEIKWRFFGQRHGREDKDNSLSHLSTVLRDELRRELLKTIARYKSIKILVSVVHLPTVYTLAEIQSPDAVYSRLYQSLTERFQSYLEGLSKNLGSKVNGIIVCDNRNPVHDRDLRNLHIRLVNSQGTRSLKFNNLIENLFLSPSHHSIGIQFADLISGSMFRYFEHQDDRFFKLIEGNFLVDKSGKVEGCGLMKIPSEWKEKDAESKEPFEPALVTQSQRSSHGN